MLVPLFPFLQPIFTLQEPYWIGFLVHLSSPLIYPLFAWLRRPFGQAPRTRAIRFAKRWAAGVVLVLASLSIVAIGSSHGLAVPILSRDVVGDQRYIRHMVRHHEQGIELAELGQQRAQDPHLRALAALMAAGQRGENRIFDHCGVVGSANRCRSAPARSTLRCRDI
ncbi:DUF305 domain-containing protein [Bradyrhizobium cytisi]|uniref:DUF305 domain-containing protein n=1 Tax=Bradyrhizobium cytisi TaxID=515489 RepID=UPI0024C00037|nr:DUF305 domain-containing protein [Bradyrhizobium cytisi]